MPRPTRRARLTAPGLSARLLRVRKVMGSPSGCFRDFCDADDWARILDTDTNDGDDDDRDSNVMYEDSDGEDDPSPRRGT